MSRSNLVFRHLTLWESVAGRVKAAAWSLPDNALKFAMRTGWEAVRPVHSPGSRKTG